MTGIQSPDASEILTSLDFPGDPVPLGSKFYIERSPWEARSLAEIMKPGSLLRIKAPKKMGKSSLLLRIADRAVAQGYRIVTLDFQQADRGVFANINKFLRWFCANLARQLKLAACLDDYWDEDIGSNVSCTIYFEGYLLEQIETPILLVLNEVNRVFEHPQIAQDFLPLLRFWHEQAKQEDIWTKLRIVVVHSTEIYIPLSIHHSPFNVGLPIKLTEFTPEQVQELAQRYGFNWSDRQPVQQLMNMVGGHPYLVHLALYHLCLQEISLEQLLQEAPTQAGIYSDHLRRHWLALQKQPELAAAFKKIVKAQGKVYVDPAFAYQLDSMGLVKIEGNECVLFCDLYSLYFQEQHLGEEKLDTLRLEQLEQENQRLQLLVNIDELTQIANRRHFDSCLRMQWKLMSREGCPLSLILCDLDHFKIYNDTYGHQAGDQCLREVAQTLRQAIKRPMDLAARYGGEEFAIILPKTDAKGALQVAEEIRARVRALAIMLRSEEIAGLPSRYLTLSLGVASTLPNSKNDVGALLLAADDALYESKKQGRDRVTLSQFFNFKFQKNIII
ncbi:MAG: AAA-like domain-containing protein [Actinomycetota bacterium]